MTEMTKVKRKNNRQKVTGSWNRRIPIVTVPMAPIAPQTAYAVPTGMACSPPMALYKKYMLKLTQIIKAIIHCQNSFPLLCCAFPKLMAKPVSKKPPMISKIQLIFIVSKLFSEENIHFVLDKSRRECH